MTKKLNDIIIGPTIRPETYQLKEELISLGADMVFTESELRSSRDLVKGAKVALNCTGGSCSTEIARCLGHKGVHVTYGGMSLKPVTGRLHFLFSVLPKETAFLCVQ